MEAGDNPDVTRLVRGRSGIRTRVVRVESRAHTPELSSVPPTIMNSKVGDLR